MRIYFVGAQSTGKTTMARYVSKRYRMPLLSETARSVLAKYEMSLDELRRNQDLLDQYQLEVMDEQVTCESRTKGSFVSDRAMDFLAYAAAKTTVAWNMAHSDRWKEYLPTLLKEDAYIFFVRPHKEFVVPDNVRAKADLEWDEVVKIDAMIEYLLESNGLRYFPLASRLLRDRIRLVDAVIELAIKIENADNAKGQANSTRED